MNHSATTHPIKSGQFQKQLFHDFVMFLYCVTWQKGSVGLIIVYFSWFRLVRIGMIVKNQLLYYVIYLFVTGWPLALPLGCAADGGR
jgi:hypothetical protein